MRFLLDENIPRSLATSIASLGHEVSDVRDIGLKGHPDTEVLDAATALDAIIITRDRGFTFDRAWPPDFTAGVIFLNLSDETLAIVVASKVLALLSQRLPVSLLGAVTFVEPQRALSRIVRRRT